MVEEHVGEGCVEGVVIADEDVGVGVDGGEGWSG